MLMKEKATMCSTSIRQVIASQVCSLHAPHRTIQPAAQTTCLCVQISTTELMKGAGILLMYLANVSLPHV